MNLKFISGIVASAGIKIVRTRERKFIFARLIDRVEDTGQANAIDVSRPFRSEADAITAAHKHYKLRTN